MKIGQKYNHVHLANLTCIIVSLTEKGAKVMQTEGKKTKTAFYNRQDFYNRPLWIAVNLI